MHGLIFCTVGAFVADSFGPDVWARALAEADIDVTSFEAMLHYDDALLPRVLNGCAGVLERDVPTVLEDIGTHLVTHRRRAFVRRLMRFGGGTFVELLQSLDELPGRTRLAVPGLDLPEIAVSEHKPHRFTIRCGGAPAGFGFVLMGLLRALADDYGTLAVLEHLGIRDGDEFVEVTVHDTSFAEDRGFSLSQQAECAAP